MSVMTAPYADEIEWPAGLSPFDARSFATQADPFAHFAWMRERAPVLKSRTPDADLWFFSRFNDVQAALRAPRRFSSSTVDPEILSFLILMDPPLHSRIRELVARAFTPKAVARFEQDIRNHVDSLLTPIVESGGGEIVDPFATPVSIGAIASLIGLPVTETDQLKDWSLDLANYFGRIARRAVGAPGDEQGFLEFLAFLKSLLDRAANGPDENIVSNLARLCRSGSLTEREATHFLAVLFNAGQDTMTILIANGFLTLAEQPALLARMRNDPADVPRFTEELARFRAAPQRLSRVAVEDCEVAGYFIPAGAEIRLLPGSANRDAAKFPDGERFDIDRDTRGHLGFGYGIHTCLGAWLARLEMRAVLELVAQKVGAVELDPTVPILYYEGGTMSNAGPRQMTVRLSGR